MRIKPLNDNIPPGAFLHFQIVNQIIHIGHPHQFGGRKIDVDRGPCGDGFHQFVELEYAQKISNSLDFKGIFVVAQGIEA